MQSLKISILGVFVLCFSHRSQALLDAESTLQKAIVQLNSTFQQTVADLRHSNAILNATVQQSASVISLMNTTILKSAVELQNAKNAISTMNTTILKSATDLQKAKNTISAMNTTIQSSGLTPPIMFHAYLSKIKSFGPDQTIEFDQVRTNVGNAYDPRHGHFTAPVDGYYHFSATAMTADGESIYISVVKNGAQIVSLFCTHSYLQVDSGSIITELVAGDMVWVKYHGYNSELHKLNGGYNNFSGFIISKSL